MADLHALALSLELGDSTEPNQDPLLDSLDRLQTQVQRILYGEIRTQTLLQNFGNSLTQFQESTAQLQEVTTQLLESTIQMNLKLDEYTQMASQGVGSSSRSGKQPSQGVGSGLRRSERIRK
ncbi:homolog of RPW8 1 [Striga asiatica]|uniref:Homolog of RPW8 1 n=1 Tax=Striga asiatica TaxID=4170 RepID=A0A5A7RFM5_STRAF|nr:homolog of RPW8 1 [Striga asiatica]